MVEFPLDVGGNNVGLFITMMSQNFRGVFYTINSGINGGTMSQAGWNSHSGCILKTKTKSDNDFINYICFFIFKSNGFSKHISLYGHNSQSNI